MNEREFRQRIAHVDLTAEEEAILRQQYRLNPDPVGLEKARKLGNGVLDSAWKKFQKGRRENGQGS